MGVVNGMEVEVEKPKGNELSHNLSGHQCIQPTRCELEQTDQQSIVPTGNYRRALSEFSQRGAHHRFDRHGRDPGDPARA